MNIIHLIVSILSGAVGGNAAGAVMKDKSLGTLGNSLAGIFGGGIGGFILSALGLFAGAGGAGADGNFDIAAILANVASGGVGGAVLLAIVSLFRKTAKQ